MTIDQARDELRAAQQAHRDCQQVAADAGVAVQRATQLVLDADAEIAKFGDLDQRIERRRTELVSAAMREDDGGTALLLRRADTLELSSDLAREEAARGAALDHREEVRTMAAALTHEHEKATAAARSALEAVNERRSAVAYATLEAVMTKIEALDDAARELRLQFSSSLDSMRGYPAFAIKNAGIGNFETYRAPEAFDRLFRKITGTQTGDCVVLRASAEHVRLTALQQRWASFLEKLMTDADAEFDAATDVA